MKKKIAMLAVLVMAVIASAYSVSGTYAKYITTKTVSDSARVAKWQIGELTTMDLFKESYLSDAVKSSVNGEDIVAPGTSGSYTFQVTGSVETNYRLNLEVTTATDTVGQIVYKLDGNKVGTNGTISELKTALERLYDGTTVYTAGNISETQHTISWEWVFEDALDASKDTTDTALGTAGTATVELKVEITAIQTTDSPSA